MMRGATFPGALLFAAAAALAAVPWTLVTVPFLWPSRSVGWFALAAAVLYTVWIAPDLRRGARTGAVAACFAALVCWLGPGLDATVLAAAAILAVARSGFLYRTRSLRALALETALLLGGLLFARLLGAATPVGVGLGVWGFFLVQSLFFLAGGVRERQAETVLGDPFEAARKKALAIIEGC